MEKWGTPEEPGYWVTAVGIEHIAESANDIIECAKALVAADAQRQNDLLIDLREHLVHLVYHVNDTPFFASVMNRVAASQGSELHSDT